MIALSSREKRLLWITLLIAFLAVLGMGVIKPMIRKLSRLRAKVALSSLDLERMKAIFAKKDAIGKAYAETQSRIATMRTRESEIIDMLMTVQKAAEGGGVDILGNEHVKDDPFEHFSRHTLHFHGQGTPENIEKMLNTLENPNLLLRIQEMNISMKNYKLDADLLITRVVCSEDEE